MFLIENILSKIGNISHIGLAQYDSNQNFSLHFLPETGKQILKFLTKYRGFKIVSKSQKNQAWKVHFIISYIKTNLEKSSQYDTGLKIRHIEKQNWLEPRIKN